MRGFACTLLLLLFPVHAFAQNGIAVGKPKIFDNRSLTIMLQELNNRLQNSSVVDQGALSKALGTTQGFERQDVTQGISVAGAIPTPSAATSDVSKLAAAPLPTVIAAPSYTPTFGQSADDLLADQVQLTYQIFNLRMLLDRSLTDRLIDHKPRRQAVISFNVTLDPQRESRDSAAYVEISIRTGRGKAPAGLVALMPQDKTYNSVALSNKATAFNGAAVAKMFSVQYAAQKSQQTFFLFRDSDTLALEAIRPREEPDDSLTFGWEFRPVLGQRSIPAGTRQVFAVVSLPADDEPTNRAEERLHVTARTYWRRFDRVSKTTTERPSWKPFIPRVPGEASFDFPPVLVPSTWSIQENLGPIVTHIAWNPTSATTGVAQIDGKNFFPGTTITLGANTYSGPADGLTIKSDQSMILNTTVNNVSLGNGVISGRYGPAVPLIHNDSILEEGLRLSAVIEPHGMQYSNIVLFLARKDGEPYDLLDLEDLTPPLVLLNGVVVSGVTPVTEQINSEGISQAAVSITLPNSVAKSLDAEYRVVFPFAGPAWSAAIYVYDDSEVDVTRLGGGACTTLLLTRHQEFKGNWKLILDKTYTLVANPPLCPAPAPATPPKILAGKTVGKRVAAPMPPAPAELSLTRPQPYTLQIRANTALLASFKKMMLISDDGVAIPIDIPSGAPPKAATPSIDGPSKDPVYLHEVRAVTFNGKSLDAVKKVLFDSKPLEFTVGSGGGQISVVVDRDVTAHTGQMTLVFQLDGGTNLTGSLNVLAASRPATQGKSK